MNKFSIADTKATGRKFGISALGQRYPGGYIGYAESADSMGKREIIMSREEREEFNICKR